MRDGQSSGVRRDAPRRSRRSAALERVEAFLREIRPDASEPTAQYVRELMVTAIRLLEDRTPIADVRLLNAAVRELRYAFRTFARFGGIRKVTVFGSARSVETDPAYRQAEEFARRIADEGYMVITGAGGGIMRACQAGAGRERSFGVNIRLPFEQRPNEFIADDPKLMTFKYFFTRKLLFVKEADAVVLFPGGFGTLDETYECLTLVQTGKAGPMPIVFVDAPGGIYWNAWRDYVKDSLLRHGLISEEDLSLFRVSDDAGVAVDEIRRFYGVYHSSRYVGDKLVIRLTRPLGADVVERLQANFAGLLVSGRFQLTHALPEEDRDETVELPRLVFHFNRVNFGRLRRMIDFLNASGT
ncbi:MAG TPA: TIGR00730 family Rossman fold protein [Candidatus Binatia bacterium]|nr:TIGR00730 family Rossman fold protein [Candidatus Binatia bacterium]